MKYNELVTIKSGYNDVFNMVDEQKDYWKQFVTNKKFEDNLIKILNVFTSPVENDHKSIWVQGTYGTGKSHSTSVVKHLLSDPMNEISGFINNLMNQQLRSELIAFRNKRKIFPIVIKGNHNISDATDMSYVIQTTIKNSLKQAGYELSVKSDFETILETLKKPTYEIFVNDLIKHDLYEYVATKEELFASLENEDAGILKIITKKLKNDNLHVVTTNIVSWLKEVRDYLRKNNIANDLVIFWDEFTSLLSITERRAIYSLTQDIAEISTTHESGVYMFIITHILIDATEVYKDMSANEKDHIRDRFIVLPYEIQYDTTYTILYSAMERIKPDELSKLVDQRIKMNLEVGNCLDSVVANTADPNDSKNKLYGLYPFHPYTAYISTFLARIIGSSERSVFNFLNNDEFGFLAFTKNDVNDVKFLTIDMLWDFFFEKFKENIKYSEIVEIFRKHMDSIKSKGKLHYSIFKSILLLNIMKETAGTDEDSDERNLTSPSIKNIYRAFSGSYKDYEIENALSELEESGTIQKTPDNTYEFAVSSVPVEKIETKKAALTAKYISVPEILNDFSSTASQLKEEITLNVNLKRPSQVYLFGANWKEANVTNQLDMCLNGNKGIVTVALFLHLGFPISEKDAELSNDELRAKLIELSSREKYKNIVFLQIDNVMFGQARYKSFIDRYARMMIANESSSTAEAATNKSAASKWVKQYIDEVIEEGKVHLIFNGSNMDVAYEDVAQKINSQILPHVYKYGLDSLKILKNTVWKPKQKPQDKSISKMFEETREEVLKAVPTNLNDLLMSSPNSYVFDSKMEIFEEAEETPVTKLCKEVRKIMDEHLNDTSFDTTQCFDWIFEPPYGYIMTDACMGAVALAFRPYIGKMFVADTGSSIDSRKMIAFVGALFDYFLKEKSNPILTVRFSSKEERDLMETLITYFGLETKASDGLLNIKWNLRDKFKKDNKAPLWVLKYIPKENNKLKNLFDILFEFTQKQNGDIDESLVKQLLNELKDKRIEITNALSEVKKQDCMQKYIEYRLAIENHPELDVTEAQTYLEKSNLSGELVFWSEEDVNKEISNFVDSKVNPVLFGDEEEGEKPVTPVTLDDSKVKKVLDKISNRRLDATDLENVLRKYISKRPAAASEILAIIEEIENK